MPLRFRLSRHTRLTDTARSPDCPTHKAAMPLQVRSLQYERSNHLSNGQLERPATPKSVTLLHPLKLRVVRPWHAAANPASVSSEVRCSPSSRR
eukprot:scaffold214109_cov41-Prasinocladus_malaysianus.AAC.1